MFPKMSLGLTAISESLVFAVVLFSSSSPVFGQTHPPIPDLSKLNWETINPPNRERLRQVYEKALSNPEDGEAAGQLGIMLQALDQFSLAATCYDRAHRLEPRAFRWTYYLGVAKAAQGERSEAVGLLRKAVELKPDYLPARLKLADAWLAAGNVQESQKAYEDVVKQFPESAAAYYGLGRIQASKGQFALAVSNLKKACALFPEFGPAYYALGIIYRDQGRSNEAQKLLSLFELHKKSYPRVRDPLLDAVDDLRSGANDDLSRGLRLLEGGHPKEAVGEFERALQKNPDLAQAHANLLSAYLELGDLNKAEEHYHAAIKIDPNLYEAHYNYGLLLMREGKAEKAEDAFRRTLEINPFYAEAHNNLAYILAEEGKVDEATRHFLLAIDNKPNFRDAHFNLGQIELAQGKTQEAIDHLLKAVTVEDEKTSLCMLSLAKAYLQAGNREKGIYYAEQAERYATSFRQTALVQEIGHLLKQLNHQE